MEGSRLTYVVVQAGETWANLSERYGNSTEELQRLNGGLGQVKAGDVVKVWQQAPDFRQPKTRPRHVLGFYTGPMGESLPGSQGSLERHAELLTSIAPYWFDLDRKAIGRIKPRIVPAVIKEGVADAHRRGVKVLASIHNTDKAAGTSGEEILHSVLRAHRGAFFNHLFAQVAEYGFDGVNLDFEHLRAGDKNLYTDFVRDLSARAHQKGLLVTVDVLGDARKQPYSLDFDYPGLAEAVDYLAIMTYDQTKPSEPKPGPIAALPWVRDTLLKAIEEGVPPQKILLGIPFYGYDWTVGQPGARALSYGAVQRLQRQYNGTAIFDSNLKEWHMTYKDGRGQQHEVWYEDARSLAPKLDLVRRYNLGGVVLWRLGLEDPAAWGVIRAKLSPIA